MSQTEIDNEQKVISSGNRAEYLRNYYESNKEKIKRQQRENYAKKYKSDKPVGRPKGTTGSYKSKWLAEGMQQALKNMQPEQETTQ